MGEAPSGHAHLVRRRSRRAGAAVLGFALTVVLCSGSISCSVSTGDVTRPGSCEPFQLTATSPAPGAVDVPPDVTFGVTFNDFPDPDTVDISNLTLFTGLFYHTGRYWVDLVDRRALIKPSGPLTMGLGYTFSVRAAVRSLRGCQLELPPLTSDGRQPSAYYFMFQTVEPGVARTIDPSMDRPAQPVVRATSFTDVVDLFGGHCAGVGCHLGAGGPPTDDATCFDAPAGALSLCARDAYDQLLGVQSVQANRLVRVAPRDSARSYLLRKLVGAPPLVGHTDSPQNGLSREDLLAIEAWIDTGALR